MKYPLREIDPNWSYTYMQCDPTDFLVALYDDYCRVNKLPLVSADEQDFSELTAKQIEWIESFIIIWDSLHV